MTELYLLPSSTYQPPSPSLERRQGRSLNTIMEEESMEARGRSTRSQNRKTQTQASNEKIVQWLSPRSDQFPTPRGFHFLSAPILPESPSTVSIDESNSPSISSVPWTRASMSTDVTEFDELYDISDEEDQRRTILRTSSLKRRNSSRNTMAKRPAVQSGASPRSLPPLVIPTVHDSTTQTWSAIRERTKFMSPVPPTPPAKVEMSPAVRSFLQSQQSLEVPTISAPPSLDGSLSSEQLAAMSAPQTPVTRTGDDDSVAADWSGVQLQPAAFATLQALAGSEDDSESYESENVIEVPEVSRPEMMQQGPRVFASVPLSALRLSSMQQPSLDGLTKLDIPSPGGFFSGLSTRARHTWHLQTKTPDENAPPTSTTAEQFYRFPWSDAAPPVPSASSIPPSARTTAVEHIIEIRGTMSDGMPTARPIILEQVIEAGYEEVDGPLTAWRIEPGHGPASSAAVAEPQSPNEGLIATEIVTVYDPEYAKKQKEEALSNLDRTELWLMAQKSYLQGVLPENEREQEPEAEQGTVEIHTEELKGVKSPQEPEPGSQDASPTQKKKAVRFSEIVIKADIPRSLPSKLLRQESAYYRAFQEHIIRSRSRDTFVHCLPRFEALQAQRVSLREAHRNQLLGKYQLSVVPQSARKRMSANVVRGDDVLVDDPEKLRHEKEYEALTQMSMSNWHVSATKALNGGRLFTAPIATRLARLSRIGGAKDRARILDLGGQAACDWAWHCAIMYPSTKVYTVTTKAIRQLSNSNIRGPPNHRQVAVERLSRLPFPDAHFDLVSARELHSILKFIGENGEDEWETCLNECMRVLKPGGYLEYSILDSDIMNAGPLGLAKSVEFGFSLKTLGYDPNPTKLFLSRLHRAGFDGVRRAWMCLPMGENPEVRKQRTMVRDSRGVERPLQLEAIVQGSTDAAANVTGLAGSWAWERWLLRCEMEKVVCEGRLLETAEMRQAGKCLDGVHGIIEEGRRCGAGWRVLNGFARKPR